MWYNQGMAIFQYNAKDADGNEINSDMYNLGYIGRFYGTPVVVTPQRHKVGTTEFVMDDDMLTIIAGDNKPIKVNERLAAA